MSNNTKSKLNILFLKQGPIEIGILPELGGSIAFAKYNNIDFMRPWTGELTPRRTCCYPLVPFSNRIANGQFNFAGKPYQLAKNFDDHPHTIHGVAWQQEWHVVEHQQNYLILSYEHQPQSSWPFKFNVTQQFIISDDNLLVKMTIENKENFITPVGFGWHPFFPRHENVRLQFKAEKVLLNNSSMLPQKIIDIPNDWNFSNLRKLEEPKLDNCFINWQQLVKIEWEKQNLELLLTASKNLQHLVVMTPAFNHFFAVEPVSNINNAINEKNPQENGIFYLEKEEILSGWMSLKLKTYGN